MYRYKLYKTLFIKGNPKGFADEGVFTIKEIFKCLTENKIKTPVTLKVFRDNLVEFFTEAEQFSYEDVAPRKYFHPVDRDKIEFIGYSVTLPDATLSVD
jgi:hypothetical protein